MIRLAHYAVAKQYSRPWIAISNGVPKWIDVDEHRRDLAPEWSDVEAAKSGRMTIHEFTRRYWAQLNALYAFGGMSLELPDDCTLFCWEKPVEFCHRRILAAFLVRHGVDVELDGQPVGSDFRIGAGI